MSWSSFSRTETHLLSLVLIEENFYFVEDWVGQFGVSICHIVSKRATWLVILWFLVATGMWDSQ
jgi:hypothetical protein